MTPAVWRVEPAAAYLAAHPSAPTWLSEAELARRGALRRSVDRDAFTAAHALARHCAAALLGTSPAAIPLVQRCETCGGPHGRPVVASHPEVWLSLSHSGAWVAAAASLMPCGIDIEDVAPSAAREMPVVDRALSPRERTWIARQPDRERAFLALWARKEALIKSGVGSLDELADLDLIDDDGEQLRAVHAGRRIQPLDASPHAIGALAVSIVA